MKKTYILKQWSVITINPYAAPENGRICLSGYRDGEIDPVVTTSVIGSKGRIVETKNSFYILDNVSSEYDEWYKKFSGKNLDEENPVKIGRV